MEKQVKKNRHIAVFVIGLTSQIITETLYAFFFKSCPPISINTIYVITTIKGKKLIKSTILDNGKGYFYKFCDNFNINPKQINFNENNIFLLTDDKNTALEDIRTTSDSINASNFILNFIKNICSDEHNIVHASCAGGRKTMSVFLSFALQLFGRSSDKLYHVLVSENKEKDPSFYFPDIIHDSNIELIDIPFIKLRNFSNFIQNENLDYSSTIKKTRSYLDKLTFNEDLIISINSRTLIIDDTKIKFSPKQFIVYLTFINHKLKIDTIDPMDSFIDIISLTSNENIKHMVDTYLKFYPSSSPYINNLLSDIDGKSFSQETLRSDISKINRVITNALGEFKSTLYKLTATDGPYGATRYGLLIESSNITIKDS